ncbi:hypothetical protein D4764_03G0009740, partial [Takifugu flavidus]
MIMYSRQLSFSHSEVRLVIDDPLAGKLGSEVLLKPNAVTSPITSITWKQGPNLAVQWDGTAIQYYRQFRDRSSLDVETGILTISNLS